MSQPFDAEGVSELVEWLEDISTGALGARSVAIADPAGSYATLRAFYQALLAHPQFGHQAWRGLLPGALVPLGKAIRTGPAPPFWWFALHATAAPGVEAMQLALQLDRYGRSAGAPRWAFEASLGAFRGALAANAAPSGDGFADRAFGDLTGGSPGREGDVAGAMRRVDALYESTPLLADGGVLDVDAPRPRARAAVAAAWLERVAATIPVVLAIDASHGLGTFVQHLTGELTDSPAPVLVVISSGANEPSSPAGTRGEDLLAVAARLANGPVFTTRQCVEALDLATVTIETDLEALAERGLLRRLELDVWSFADPHTFADALELNGTRSDDAFDDDRETPDGTPRATALAQVVEATRVADPGEAPRWSAATAIAKTGELQLAAHTAGGQTHRLHTRVLELWDAIERAAPDVDDGQVADVALDPLESVEAAIIDAARASALDPGGASLRLHAALTLLDAPAAAGADGVGEPAAERPDEDSDDAGDRDARDGEDAVERLRCAAARVLLGIGDLEAVAIALGDGTHRRLPFDVAEQLAGLRAWQARPGVVARTVDVLANLQLISTLRSELPGSSVLGRALLARLELLERLDRIAVADDARALASEASDIFSRREPRLRHFTVRSRSWHAWCSHRGGDASAALAELDVLLSELADLPIEHPMVTGVRYRRALVFAEVGQPSAALAELDDLLAIASPAPGDPNTEAVTRLDLREARAVCLAALGDDETAAQEFAAILEARAATVAISDEAMVATRQRHAASLTIAGHSPSALDALVDVVAARSAFDFRDAPRVLSARRSLAVCLLHLARYDDALAELDEVIALSEGPLPEQQRLQLEARADRAYCLLLRARFGEAVAEYDTVIVLGGAMLQTDDHRLLVARQQRAVALSALRRPHEAIEELERIERAAVSYPPDDAFLADVRALRAALAS